MEGLVEGRTRLAARGRRGVLPWAFVGVLAACGLVDVFAHAEPKAYVPILGGAAIIAAARLTDARQVVRVIGMGVICLTCIGFVAAGWAFPLSKAATARLLEQEHPGWGPVRCADNPGIARGGFPDPFFGRVYVCGAKKWNSWSSSGGIKLGQGDFWAVDDTHILHAVGAG